MRWSLIGYAIFCIVAPIAWGLLVVWVSNGIEHRLRRNKPDGADEVPPIDYHI
jgi:hypothetical protein